jgi:hypothetical protein
MRALLLLIAALAVSGPAFAAEATGKDGKGAPGTNVELPVLIAPVNDADGKLISYAYITGTLTASTPGDALAVRDRIAFVQDAFVRDVNGAPITRPGDPAAVDNAALTARLLADARRIIGSGRVKAVVIDRIQIAPLRPTQTQAEQAPASPEASAAPQQTGAAPAGK